MIQAVLILLGLFVVFGVAYNLFSMRKRGPKLVRNRVFSGSPTVEVMKPAREEMSREPIIDASVHPRETRTDYQAEPAVEKPISLGSHDPEESTLVSIYVMNQPAGTSFLPYELVQALASAHCHFGEMSVFHRHEQVDGQGDVLFSIAQAIKPGIFNLSDIGSIKCPGLILFMDAAMSDDPHAIFNTMLDTAEQLADDLQAKVFQTPSQPMTEASQYYYERKLSYAKRERERLKEMV